MSRFSIHRAMPVGRMAAEAQFIPSAAQYARTIIQLNELYKGGNHFTDLHLHHSLESIFSVAFLAEDIHASSLLMRTKRHSIGIDPSGGVYFDPWCMVRPFDQLKSGSIQDSASSLRELLESDDALIHLADDINARSFRCDRCRLPCSGGMRFNALGRYIGDLAATGRSVGLTDLLNGLKAKDPACPFSGLEDSIQ